ncbi:hypothetical protein LZ318_27605 [Saccharopolyspora indica]|uniref:hypothetical protein n=1 Tax=Saccharopolyspora indica TaxID=1229659 RepID=UPI0022EA8254|nr:hypothetical protein [Saccharopolyspora indica]MDA3645057.1 hypothetical protein [Saccharopolyspora indica]
MSHPVILASATAPPQTSDKFVSPSSVLLDRAGPEGDEVGGLLGEQLVQLMVLWSQDVNGPNPARAAPSPATTSAGVPGRRAEIEHLIKLSNLPNMLIQVIPFKTSPGRRSALVLS